MKYEQHRKDIEQFCRDFLKGENRHLNEVIDTCRHLFTQIDIQLLNLTQETFDSSFKNICRKLFTIRPANKNYIISLFGFALKLHEYHLSYHHSWYHIEMLIDSLTDVLTDVGFQAKELIEEPSFCMIM